MEGLNDRTYSERSDRANEANDEVEYNLETSDEGRLSSVEWRETGKMERWMVGTLEKWNSGKMKGWKAGVWMKRRDSFWS